MAVDSTSAMEVLKVIGKYFKKKDDRLQKLELLNPDSHKAVQWLRKHKKLFKADVYEPFILLISIKDDNVKNLLYSIVPRCDLEALFLFEDLDDMFIFIDECHKKHKWIVHVSTIPDINLKKLKKTTKSVMLEEILNGVDGPDAVLKYLCQSIENLDDSLSTTTNNISSNESTMAMKSTKMASYFLREFLMEALVKLVDVSFYAE
ncbi:unnamed protein product [Didymodactylos carnosus]|uniref:Uncharacterized protein n=1 Tax=Didymodactylos carnosus TaxID=1234261 RepID=A0A813VT25_9BILA|nr:unnamed protein product [Didymodactylos carnosus]CAF3633664.1 unnamed protein product [Didymodactylos carnosus]